jgi:hypothetical protein
MEFEQVDENQSEHQSRDLVSDLCFSSRDPAMLTNRELEGELGGDYASRAKVCFTGFCPSIILESRIFLAL